MVDKTRRNVLKGVGTIVGASGIATITYGATDSGNPELEITATVRENTSITIEVIESNTGTSESISIEDPSAIDGTETFVLEVIDGTDMEITNYEFSIDLNSSDGVNTPEIDAITLTLPEGEEETTEPPSGGRNGGGQGTVLGLDWLFASTTTFLFFCIFIMTLGTFGGTKQIRTSLKIAVLVLVYATYSGNEYLTGILYVVIILIALLLSNQIFSLLFAGDSSEGI